MSLPPYASISFVIEGALLMFHLSMFVVIARNVLRKVTMFSTAFFKIFLAQSLMDYVVYAWSTAFLRLMLFDVVPSNAYDVQAAGVTSYFMTAYGLNFLYFSYLLIAFNRYTAILKPFRHFEIWNSRRMLVMFALLATLPAALAAIRLFFTITAFRTETGYFMANTGRRLGQISGYISVSSCIATCVCTLTMNLHTFVAHRRLSKQHQRNCREEYHLLIYACLHLVGQVLMSAFYVLFYAVAPDIPNIISYVQTTLIHIIDTMCLSGPSPCQILNRVIGLLATFEPFSRATRQAYFKMYFAFDKSSAVFVTRAATSLT